MKALLEKCDPETIVEIEAGLPDGQGALLEAVNDGITSTTINTRDGRPKPWRYMAAVSVLRDLWPPYGGKASVAPCAPCLGRRYHVSGRETEVNPYVRWLGAHLRKLDPGTLKNDTAAQLAAHNALASLSRPGAEKAVTIIAAGERYVRDLAP